MPNRIFIKVLLPEPFSPSRPTIDPAATVRSIPTLACTGPYDLEIPRISRSAGDIAWGAPLGEGLRPVPLTPSSSLKLLRKQRARVHFGIYTPPRASSLVTVTFNS